MTTKAEKAHMDRVARLGCALCRRYGHHGTPAELHHPRTGKERVEAIEADNSTHKWTRDELVAIRRHYTAKLKEVR